MIPTSNTLKDLIAFLKNELKNYYPSGEVDAITIMVFEYLYNIKREEMALYPGKLFNESQILHLIKVIKRLKSYEPVQYIMGYTEFLDLTVEVNPSVLIPRPETEELVLWVEKELRANDTRPVNILDIGTGSGCIALALAQRLPGASVSGLDVFSEAIAVSQGNAKLNNLEANFFVKNILNIPLNDPLIQYQWDIWVSNPPYVTEPEKSQMHDNVLKYEPGKALFVKNDEPLIFYDRISSLAQKALKPGGMLFFEINEHKGQDIKDLLQDKGFSNITIKKDINDKERFVKALKL